VVCRYEGYTIDGKPWILKLKNEDYADAIPRFKKILEQIGQQHGWTLQDLKMRFSNDLFDYLIFDDAKAEKRVMRGIRQNLGM
jgi:hypothetical protein